MSFKEMVEADFTGVFLNTDEFAEPRTVKYDDETYADIPVVLTNIKQKDRPLLVGNADHVQGLHIASATAFIGQEHMNGVHPEMGRLIYISDGYAAGEVFFQRFRIVTSDIQMKMIVLELEAYDE